MSRSTSAPEPGRVAASSDAATGEDTVVLALDGRTDGRSARWDGHRAARRTELVRAARKTVHRHGPDVSMETIAATAGTSKSIVYRYFTDKTGLQVAVGEAVVRQMHAALAEAAGAAETPRDALRSMIDVYLEMVESSPNVYWFVTRPLSEDASAPLGHFLDAVADLIARPFVEVLTGRAQDTALAEVWAAGAVGFVRGAGDWWLTHRTAPGAPSRSDLTDRVTAWLWAGPVSGLLRSRLDDGAPTTVVPVSTDAPPLSAEEQP